MADKSQYEIVLFPRLHHVRFGFVEIDYRNAHVHREMELMMVLEGTARAKLKNGVYMLKPGMLLAVNSNEAHEVTALNGEMVRIMYLQISNNFCRDYLQMLHEIVFEKNNVSDLIDPALNEQIIHLMLEAYMHYTDERPGSRLKCMSDIFSLLEKLIDIIPYSMRDESERISGKKFKRLEKITDYVDRHYYEKISLASLAEEEDVTVSYLSRFIHNEMGMTFQDYVSSVRLEKAMMLMGSDMKLIDISVCSGFSDVKYFINTFRKHFKCDPEEFRKNGLRKPDELKEKQMYVPEATAATWLRRFREEMRLSAN